MNTMLNIKNFLIITLLTSIWVNISEVARYFIYVKGKMDSFLHMVPNIGLIWDVEVLIIYAVWDTLITAYFVFIFCLCMKVFGNNMKAIFVSALTSWMFFVLFWLILIGMQLGEWSTMITILPFTLLETIVASYIASRLYAKRGF